MQSPSDRSVTVPERPGPSISATARALLLPAILCAMQSVCVGQTNGVLCYGGLGKFTTNFRTGMTVRVGAAKSSDFSTRACEATLIWGRKEVQVANGAAQIDIDLLGADLGLGAPVVAFQIKQSDINPRMSYAVYSLKGPPRLLRTVSGGDYFRAADTKLEGRIEIWAGDAAAADEFDGLPLADFDSAPALVLRFEEKRLIDVSAEFQSYYDRQIAEARAQLDPQLLSAFKNGDGRLKDVPASELIELHGLMTTKIKVLEIVWAYLYSGREQEAWKALAEMWPAADFERVRAAIADRRAGGIHSQVDGSSPSPIPAQKKMRVPVYDLSLSGKTQEVAIGRAQRPSDINKNLANGSSLPNPEIDMPVRILIFSWPPPDDQQALPRSGVLLGLVVDAAGKVFSVELPNKQDDSPASESLMRASADWKFIPAMKDGQAVASRIQLIFDPTQ
jgi:hypothetical protein